jgi:hypothetical protein
MRKCERVPGLILKDGLNKGRTNVKGRNVRFVAEADDALSSFLSVNRHIVHSVQHVASRGDFMVFYLSSLVNSGLYFISLKR